jgi:hypothetical protein
MPCPVIVPVAVGSGAGWFALIDVLGVVAVTLLNDRYVYRIVGPANSREDRAPGDP